MIPAIASAQVKSFQDVLNFEIKLNNKLAALASTVGTGSSRPTEQQYAVYDDLAARVDEQFKRIEPILTGNIPNLIQEIDQQDIEIQY